MREEDKPFVLYRKSAFSFTITPRGVKGWSQFGVWMLMLVPLLVWFDRYSAAHAAGPGFAKGMALFIGGMLFWTVGGFMWMRARAEVVDLAEVLKQKREQDRKRR